jgi:hypothetical protein
LCPTSFFLGCFMKDDGSSYRSLGEIVRSAERILRKTRRLLGEAWEIIERAKLSLPKQSLKKKR